MFFLMLKSQKKQFDLELPNKYLHQDQEHIQIVQVRTAADLHRKDQTRDEENGAARKQQQLLPAIKVPAALPGPDEDQGDEREDCQCQT